MSDRNIIKKQTIYIANSNNEQKDEQIPHVRVSKGQIRRLIRHQSSTDQSSQQPERQRSQILDVVWNRDTFQDTTPAFQNSRPTRHHHQTQPQQEQQQGRHDHADDSQLSDNTGNNNNNNNNWITETEEKDESGLWHGYVYPTGWNKSTFNNDLFPLSGSIRKFPLSWPLRSFSSAPSPLSLDIPWLALVECTLQTKQHLRSATQLGAKAVILYPSTTTTSSSSSHQAELVHCYSLLTSTNAFGDSDVDSSSASVKESVVVPTLTLDALTAKDLLTALQGLGDTESDVVPATVTLANSIQEEEEEAFKDDKNEGENDSSSIYSSMVNEQGMRDKSGSVVVAAALSSKVHSSSGGGNSNSTGTTTTATDENQQRVKELLMSSLSNALKSGTLLARGVMVRLGLDNGSVVRAGLDTIVTPTPKVESLSAASSSPSSTVAAGRVEKEDLGMVSTRFSPLSASGIKPDLIPTTGRVDAVVEQQQKQQQQRVVGGLRSTLSSMSALSQASSSPIPKGQPGEAGARGVSTATAAIVSSQQLGGPARIAAALSMRQATAERISMKGANRRQSTTVPSGSNPSVSIIGRLIQRIYAFSPSKLVQDTAILVKDDSLTGKLAMVLMSTICGVGVGMFGALLFVVALKVRVFQTRRRGGVEDRFGLTLQATTALQHQQQLREHGYKKVIPIGILESFGVQTVLHTSTLTMMTSKGEDDIQAKPRSCHTGSSKGKLAYAEDVFEMEEGLQDLTARENSRRERERMSMARTSSHLFPRTPTGSSGHHHPRRVPTAEWDSYFEDEGMDDITAHSSSQDHEHISAAAEGETDFDEGEGGAVPDQASMDMERLAAAIMTATRRGSYRRISLSRSSASETIEHAADGSTATTTTRSTSVSTSITLALSPQKHQGGCCGTNGNHHHGEEKDKKELPFANANAQTMCAICLGEYEVGDQVRTLPCYHQSAFESTALPQQHQINGAQPNRFLKYSIRSNKGKQVQFPHNTCTTASSGSVFNVDPSDRSSNEIQRAPVSKQHRPPYQPTHE
ncbi:hypothetical protein KI688_011995 [Linnemannia hyalina]|uniref:Uncharacterized protein n=1 Tax=Linnemannia hyalina TaxID=64524 RepID=A0A9P7XVZ1_9FUNG|nr:hypothetical protein KI688_011995 [Linnemannia hyalina]